MAMTRGARLVAVSLALALAFMCSGVHAYGTLFTDTVRGVTSQAVDVPNLSSHSQTFTTLDFASLAVLGRHGVTAHVGNSALFEGSDMMLSTRQGLALDAGNQLKLEAAGGSFSAYGSDVSIYAGFLFKAHIDETTLLFGSEPEMLLIGGTGTSLSSSLEPLQMYGTWGLGIAALDGDVRISSSSEIDLLSGGLVFVSAQQDLHLASNGFNTVLHAAGGNALLAASDANINGRTITQLVAANDVNMSADRSLHVAGGLLLLRTLTDSELQFATGASFAAAGSVLVNAAELQLNALQTTITGLEGVLVTPTSFFGPASGVSVSAPKLDFHASGEPLTVTATVFGNWTALSDIVAGSDAASLVSTVSSAHLAVSAGRAAYGTSDVLQFIVDDVLTFTSARLDVAALDSVSLPLVSVDLTGALHVRSLDDDDSLVHLSASAINWETSTLHASANVVSFESNVGIYVDGDTVAIHTPLQSTFEIDAHTLTIQTRFDTAWDVGDTLAFAFGPLNMFANSMLFGSIEVPMTLRSGAVMYTSTSFTTFESLNGWVSFNSETLHIERERIFSLLAENHLQTSAQLISIAAHSLGVQANRDALASFDNIGFDDLLSYIAVGDMSVQTDDLQWTSDKLSILGGLHDISSVDYAQLDIVNAFSLYSGGSLLARSSADMTITAVQLDSRQRGDIAFTVYNDLAVSSSTALLGITAGTSASFTSLHNLQHVSATSGSLDVSAGVDALFHANHTLLHAVTSASATAGRSVLLAAGQLAHLEAAANSLALTASSGSISLSSAGGAVFVVGQNTTLSATVGHVSVSGMRNAFITSDEGGTISFDSTQLISLWSDELARFSAPSIFVTGPHSLVATDVSIDAASTYDDVTFDVFRRQFYNATHQIELVSEQDLALGTTNNESSIQVHARDITLEATDSTSLAGVGVRLRSVGSPAGTVSFASGGSTQLTALADLLHLDSAADIVSRDGVALHMRATSKRFDVTAQRGDVRFDSAGPLRVEGDAAVDITASAGDVALLSAGWLEVSSQSGGVVLRSEGADGMHLRATDNAGAIILDSAHNDAVVRGRSGVAMTSLEGAAVIDAARHLKVDAGTDLALRTDGLFAIDAGAGFDLRAGDQSQPRDLTLDAARRATFQAGDSVVLLSDGLVDNAVNVASLGTGDVVLSTGNANDIVGTAAQRVTLNAGAAFRAVANDNINVQSIGGPTTIDTVGDLAVRVDSGPVHLEAHSGAGTPLTLTARTGDVTFASGSDATVRALRSLDSTSRSGVSMALDERRTARLDVSAQSSGTAVNLLAGGSLVVESTRTTTTPSNPVTSDSESFVTDLPLHLKLRLELLRAAEESDGYRAYHDLNSHVVVDIDGSQGASPQRLYQRVRAIAASEAPGSSTLPGDDDFAVTLRAAASVVATGTDSMAINTDREFAIGRSTRPQVSINAGGSDSQDGYAVTSVGDMLLSATTQLSATAARQAVLTGAQQLAFVAGGSLRVRELSGDVTMRADQGAVRSSALRTALSGDTSLVASTSGVLSVVGGGNGDTDSVRFDAYDVRMQAVNVNGALAELDALASGTVSMRVASDAVFRGTDGDDQFQRGEVSLSAGAALAARSSGPVRVSTLLDGAPMHVLARGTDASLEIQTDQQNSPVRVQAADSVTVRAAATRLEARSDAANGITVSAVARPDNDDGGQASIEVYATRNIAFVADGRFEAVGLNSVAIATTYTAPDGVGAPLALTSGRNFVAESRGSLTSSAGGSQLLSAVGTVSLTTSENGYTTPDKAQLLFTGGSGVSLAAASNVRWSVGSDVRSIVAETLSVIARGDDQTLSRASITLDVGDSLKMLSPHGTAALQSGADLNAVVSGPFLARPALGATLTAQRGDIILSASLTSDVIASDSALRFDAGRNLLLRQGDLSVHPPANTLAQQNIQQSVRVAAELGDVVVSAGTSVAHQANDVVGNVHGFAWTSASTASISGSSAVTLSAAADLSVTALDRMAVSATTTALSGGAVRIDSADKLTISASDIECVSRNGNVRVAASGAVAAVYGAVAVVSTGSQADIELRCKDCRTTLDSSSIPLVQYRAEMGNIAFRASGFTRGIYLTGSTGVFESDGVTTLRAANLALNDTQLSVDARSAHITSSDTADFEGGFSLRMTAGGSLDMRAGSTITITATNLTVIDGDDLTLRAEPLHSAQNNIVFNSIEFTSLDVDWFKIPFNTEVIERGAACLYNRQVVFAPQRAGRRDREHSDLCVCSNFQWQCVRFWMPRLQI